MALRSPDSAYSRHFSRTLPMMARMYLAHEAGAKQSAVPMKPPATQQGDHVTSRFNSAETRPTYRSCGPARRLETLPQAWHREETCVVLKSSGHFGTKADISRSAPMEEVAWYRNCKGRPWDLNIQHQHSKSLPDHIREGWSRQWSPGPSWTP